MSEKYTLDYFGLIVCEMCDTYARGVFCETCEDSNHCEYCGLSDECETEIYG